MANKFKQHQLPWVNDDVDKAIKEREGNLAKLGQDYDRTNAESRKIRHKLTRQSTGAYPDSDSEDPLVDKAHKKSIDLVEECERLASDVPSKRVELEALMGEFEWKKSRMDRIVFDGSTNVVDTAKLMRMKILDDEMMVLV
jgi:hypothetical protein